MPLLLSPAQIALGQYSIQPITTPARTKGIFLQNVSSLSLVMYSRIGGIQIPPAFVATLPMDENDQITFTAIPPANNNWPTGVPQYIDLSYSFESVAPSGTGLFITPMAPGGGAILAQLTGSSPPVLYDASDWILIDSGTIAVTNGGTQYPSTGTIVRPTSVPRNLALLLDNESGLSIDQAFDVYVLTSQLPNVASNKAIQFGSAINLPVNPMPNASQIGVGITTTSNPPMPNPFIGNEGIAFTFTLSAAPTAAGTINWALIGY